MAGGAVSDADVQGRHGGRGCAAVVAAAPLQVGVHVVLESPESVGDRLSSNDAAAGAADLQMMQQTDSSSTS